jgi:hypothetical protein
MIDSSERQSSLRGADLPANRDDLILKVGPWRQIRASCRMDQGMFGNSENSKANNRNQ